MGIVAFILSFFVQLVALILGIIALVQSRKAGHKNGWAVAAIIISCVLMVLGVILFFAIVIPLVTFSAEALQACQAWTSRARSPSQGSTVDCSTAQPVTGRPTRGAARSARPCGSGVRGRRQSRMRQCVVSAPMPSMPTVTVERSRRNTCGSRE